MLMSPVCSAFELRKNYNLHNLMESKFSGIIQHSVVVSNQNVTLGL